MINLNVNYVLPLKVHNGSMVSFLVGMVECGGVRNKVQLLGLNKDRCSLQLPKKDFSYYYAVDIFKPV